MSTISRVTPATEPTAAPRQSHVLVSVVRRCLRDQRRSPLTWGIPLGLMSALELAIFPSVEDSMSKLIKSYPEALKEAFNITTMSTPAEFLNGEMFSLIIPLAIAFFAIRAATRAVSAHEERHWLDTVLAAPVRRRTLVAGAFIASAISSLLILMVNAVLSWSSGQIFGASVPVGDLAAATVGTWAFAVFFAGVASMAAGRLGSHAAVTGIGAGLLVTMYVVDVTARIASSLHDLGPLTAFHYYGSPLVDGLNVANSAGLLGLGIVFAALGAVLLEHRDIHG